MTVYILEIMVPAFLLILHRKNANKRSRRDRNYLKMCFVLFFLVMALRDPHLGTDSWMYGDIYRKIGKAPNLLAAIKASTISAPLYTIVCRILYFISDSRQMLIICSALVVNICFYNFIKRESKDYYLSALLFLTLAFYFQSFNTTRQYIAVGLALNAYSYWRENIRSRKALLFYISCVLVHPVSIICGIYYFLLKNREMRDKKTKIKTAVIILVVIFGESLLTNVFVKIFPQYASYFLSDSTVTYGQETGKGRQAIIIVGYLALVFYAFMQWKSTSKQNWNITSLLQEVKFPVQMAIMAIGVIVGLLGVRSWSINRISLFFTTISVCFIPNTFIISERYFQINWILRALTALLTIGYCTIYLLENKAGIIPYGLFFY